MKDEDVTVMGIHHGIIHRTSWVKSRSKLISQILSNSVKHLIRVPRLNFQQLPSFVDASSLINSKYATLIVSNSNNQDKVQTGSSRQI